ncbi:MAG: hypothetical protein EZS28_042626 [Streblomastix strix]|uniref:Cyclin N-terminal domain-containing protein n=1 Tax=Streblomastix strix TaxID=222440 RepID=A0A5J4TUA9_9EUKA|nr:MAG: hypothetical protein EZS28_042626 [Streblomastix strix]
MSAIEGQSECEDTTQKDTKTEIQFDDLKNIDTIAQALGGQKKAFQKIAAKILSILHSAIQELDEIVSFNNIEQFLLILKNGINFSVSEGLVATELLSRFINKNTKREALGKRGVLYNDNIGTMLVCLTLITQKICRDSVTTNSFFASQFTMQTSVLNLSEVTFLKLMQFDLWVEEKDFWKIFQEVANEQIEGEILNSSSTIVI